MREEYTAHPVLHTNGRRVERLSELDTGILSPGN